jgi:hypothetical protein
MSNHCCNEMKKHIEAGLYRLNYASKTSRQDKVQQIRSLEPSIPSIFCGLLGYPATSTI